MSQPKLFSLRDRSTELLLANQRNIPINQDYDTNSKNHSKSFASIENTNEEDNMYESKATFGNGRNEYYQAYESQFSVEQDKMVGLIRDKKSPPLNRGNKKVRVMNMDSHPANALIKKNK